LSSLAFERLSGLEVGFVFSDTGSGNNELTGCSDEDDGVDEEI
jgi:hypothetical protein